MPKCTHPSSEINAALERCAAEVIHCPGTIQPHGCLIALDASLIIRHVSMNSGAYLGMDSKQLIGKSVSVVFDAAVAMQVETIFRKQEIGQITIIESIIPAGARAHRLSGQAHFVDGLVLVDLQEDLETDRRTVFETLFIPVRDYLWSLETESNLERYMSAVAKQIGVLTGIDRVMVYRFDSEWDGEVIAEYRHREVESFLGHHFPASDIPPQARELYRKNRLRTISDINAESVPVLPPINNNNGQPLDLSYSVLRSFSPVHLEYLRNMGVSATITFSLITEGRLWGLIACHNYTPFNLPSYLRELADFVGRSASLQITEIERREQLERISRAEAFLGKLGQFCTHTEMEGALQDGLLELVGASGAVICVGQKKYRSGNTPDLAFINHLVDWLRTQARMPVFATDALPKHFAPANVNDGTAYGLLAVPGNLELTNYVLWFRPEIKQAIRWAGNPDKMLEIDSDGVRVSPRKSFSAWIQSYDGHSLKWSFSDIDVGQRLSLALMTQIAKNDLQVTPSTARDLLIPDSHTLVGSLDPYFQYHNISDNVTTILGFSTTDLINRPLSNFVFADDIRRVENCLADSPQNQLNTSQGFIFRHCKKDGRFIWLEWLASPSASSSFRTLPFIARDVTERQQHNAGLEDLHRRYYRVLDAAHEGFLILDKSKHILHASPNAGELLGYAADDLVSMDYGAELRIYRPEGQDSSEGTPENNDHIFRKVPHKHRDGTCLLLETCAVPVEYPLDSGPAKIIICRKTTNEPEKATSVDQAPAPIGVVVTDRNGIIRAVNESFSGITGYLNHEVVGRTPAVLRSDIHSFDFYKRFWHSLASKRYWRGEIWNRRKNGEVYPQLSNVFAIHGDDGSVRHYVGVIQDVTAVVSKGERVHSLPDHDALTGLPTRMLFDQIVSEAIHVRGRENPFAVAFLDLDRYTEINEALGHITGDRLLYLIANRLSAHLRSGDRLGRWGGDKFLLLLADVENSADAHRLVSRYSNALEQTFAISGRAVQVHARVGISLYPRDGDNADALMQAADVAQGHAKKLGLGAIVVYHPELGAATANRFALSNDLREAIRNKALFLVYQPQVDPHTGVIVGLEALIRWRHPIRGLVPPHEFVKLAEESNIIEELGTEVFRLAMTQIKAWTAAGHFNIPVGINVSPMQLKPELIDTLRNMLTTYGISPHLIEIEITESALQPTPAIRHLVQGIKDLGVALAIDDFGTGYSSLSHIRLFPFDRLKIDKSFIDGLPSKADDLAIAQTIIALAKAIRVNVLAEGVEYIEQAECLMSEGVHVIQGYLYSRPLSAQDVQNYLSESTPLALAAMGTQPPQ